MKLFITICLALMSPGTTADSTLYGISFNTIDGQQHSIGDYNGEKIWVVVLPSTQTQADSAYLNRIDSIAIANAGNLKTIAVPSYEDGYSDSLLSTLQPFYQGLLDTSITITQGMNTHQSSGSLQAPLFNWLTHVSQNTHFEQEVTGPGQTYFITSQGELYGVFGNDVRNSDDVFTLMLR